MNIKELRSKTVEELTQEIDSLAKEHFNLRMQRSMSQQPKPHLFKRVRRMIAKIKTVLTEKKGETA